MKAPAKTYSEKLRDPRWQKKRLEVLEQNNWTCSCCGATEKELHVHHKLYLKGLQPWEYEDWAYKAVCAECHPEVQDTMELMHTALARNPDLAVLVILAYGDDQLCALLRRVCEKTIRGTHAD